MVQIFPKAVAVALQQACRPATRDEYFINAVDRKLQNKQKSAKKVVIVVI